MATILITGANRGIGLGLARRWREAGHEVIGTARDPERATELAALGARVEAVDVTDEASVEALAGRLAGVPIDILVNNAGQQIVDHTLDTFDVETMVAVYRLNTLGPLIMARALRPNLAASKRKVILNISSDLGSVALNEAPADQGWYSYRASKGALNMITKNLARELGPEGFICVALHPGWVRTDMGGPRAPLGVEESTADIVALVDRLSPDDNGRYVRHDGQPMPW